MPIEYLRKDDVRPLLHASASPLLVEFSSFSCPPCALMEPEIEAFATRQSQVRVVGVNAELCPAAAQHFGVRLFPAVLFLYQQKPVALEYGAMREEEIAAFARASLEKAGIKALF